MAAIAAFTINDGETTPVAHALNPVQSIPFALWRENLSGVPLIGQVWVKLWSTRDPKQGLNRVKSVIAIPVQETIGTTSSSGYTAAPKVAHVLQQNSEFIMHDRSVKQERKNLRVLSQNLWYVDQFIKAVDDLESVF